MLSSQDEACKFLVRSKMISLSVNGNSYFFQQFFPKKGWKGITFTTSLNDLSQKSCFFFSEGKILGILMWRVILVILGIIMINVAYLSVMFSLSRLKYCFWCLQGKF